MFLEMVFNEFINDKIIDVVDSTIETIENRYKIIDKYFHKIDIESVNNKNVVREFQKYLLKDCNYSVSHTNHIVGLLKQIFKFAKEMGIIECNRIASIPTIKKQVKIVEEKNVWNLKQYNDFRSNINVIRDKVIFDMLYYLGLRKGELLSLKWSEIDFYNKKIRILSTASRKRGVGQVVTPPKTVKANRTLYMNESLCSLLLTYYLSLKNEYPKISDVFVVGNKKMMSFSVLQRLLNQYQELVDLPKITLHGFRHSHATMLAELTTDVKSVSEHLGHENIEVTVDTYYHSTDKSQEKLAQIIEDKILSENKTQYEILKGMIEKLLVGAIGSTDYTSDELDKIIHIYDYVRKEVVIN